MNTSLIADRLQMLINYYHLSSSSFADSINVQRSGISHILSGRNKPSLDFIEKVTNVYKDVSLEWLLLGKGAMLKENGINTSDLNPPDKIPVFENEIQKKENTQVFPKEDLFTEKAEKHDIPYPKPEIPKDPVETKKESTTSKLLTTDKDIVKIIFVYQDASFDILYPNK